MWTEIWRNLVAVARERERSGAWDSAVAVTGQVWIEVAGPGGVDRGSRDTVHAPAPALCCCGSMGILDLDARTM